MALAGPGEPLAVAVHLHGPERDLGPERGGFGVHAVGAPGHRDGLVGMGLGGDRHLERGGGLEHEVAGLDQHHREGGVDDVAGREAVVEPGAGGGPDPLLDHVDEGGDVVFGGALPVVDGLDGEIGPFPDGHRVGGGDHPQLGPRLGGQDLHLQPGAEASLVGEQAGDLRQCVAVYQGGPSSCRTLYEPETARNRPARGGSGSDRGGAREARRSVGGDELHEALDGTCRRVLRGVRPALVRRVSRPTAQGRWPAAVHPVLARHRRGADPSPGALARRSVTEAAAAAMSPRYCIPVQLISAAAP